MDSVTIILDREQHRPPVNLNRSYLEKGMLMVHPVPDGPPLPNRGADKKKVFDGNDLVAWSSVTSTFDSIFFSTNVGVSSVGRARWQMVQT